MSFILETVKKWPLGYDLDLGICTPVTSHPQEEGSRKGSVQSLKVGTGPFGQDIPKF